MQLTKEKKIDILSNAVSSLLVRNNELGGIILWCPYFPIDKDLIACTDGKVIMVGNLFFELTQEEQKGVFLHEIFHVVLGHAARAKTRDRRIWNIACDAMINTMLKQVRNISLPKGGVYLEDIIKKDHAVSHNIDDWSSEVVYEYLLKNAQVVEVIDYGSGEGLSDDIQPDINKSGDYYKVSDFDSSIQKELGQDDELRQDTWKTRLQKGNLEKIGLNRFIKEIPEVVTPWEVILRNLTMSKLSLEKKLNYKRPSRRMISTGQRVYIPSYNRIRKPKTIGVVIDTSGSIGDDLLTKFVAEVDYIRSISNSDIDLIFADDMIQSRYFIKSGKETLMTKINNREVEAKGGGGTSFHEAVEALDKNSAVIIYLTDMYGDFGSINPNTLVIWASITKDIKAPYGKVVYVG